jgi:hypothetical protein
LNLWLSGIYYQSGGLAFALQYIGIEIAVTVIEGVLLLFLAPRLAKKKERIRLRSIVYVVAANLLSLLLGLRISEIFPNLF